METMRGVVMKVERENATNRTLQITVGLDGGMVSGTDVSFKQLVFNVRHFMAPAWVVGMPVAIDVQVDEAWLVAATREMDGASPVQPGELNRPTPPGPAFRKLTPAEVRARRARLKKLAKNTSELVQADDFGGSIFTGTKPTKKKARAKKKGKR